MSIPVIDNFAYLGRKPLDTRFTFKTITEMQSCPESRLYDGILVYNNETGKYYNYKSTNTINAPLGKWKEWQQNGGVPAIDADATIDNTVGEPAVEVTKSGTDAAPKFTFEFKGLKGADGANGQPGQSAYDIAIANGFTGTEAEWLASLKGEQGQPGEQGIPGIKGDKGADGADGINGKSAYEIAVASSFIGTEEEWLNSLKGERGEQGLKGDTGAQGIQGVKGDKGDKGDNGKSAYQIALDNGFVGTEAKWLESLKGESAEGTSYDDTEIKSEIAKIWKAQGELGTKNLLVYPYVSGNFSVNGITFSVDSNGGISCSGTSTDYTVFSIARSINAYKHGSYILSNTELLLSGVVLEMGYIQSGSFVGKATVNNTQNEVLVEVNSEYDEKEIMVRIVIRPSITVDNLTIYPMLRLASDTDDAWVPYAPTNKQLAEQINANKNELAAIIGEYLPIAKGNSNKKRSVAIGATNCQFYIGTFVETYNITSASDLNFEVSAETSSGNIVAYNRAAVNWSSKTVYIYFDELTEQTTFICKCSKIQ